jgi:hypothetical protein
MQYYLVVKLNLNRKMFKAPLHQKNKIGSIFVSKKKEKRKERIAAKSSKSQCSDSNI